MDETRPSIHERDTERAKLAAALPAYEIGAILGRGAFAVVYAARHRHLEREVAIKRLSPELLREAEARQRFGAEARLLASLDHPHIVRVHDYVDGGRSAPSSWSGHTGGRSRRGFDSAGCRRRERARPGSPPFTAWSTRTAIRSSTATSSPRT